MLCILWRVSIVEIHTVVFDELRTMDSVDHRLWTMDREIDLSSMDLEVDWL